jgi:hypothetical protein
MSSPSGKVAIVTGGSRGIGAAIAVNYATHDAGAKNVVQQIAGWRKSYRYPGRRLVSSVQAAWANVRPLVSVSH